MRKLDKKVFYILLPALIGAALFLIITNGIIPLVNIEAEVAEQLELFESFGMAELYSQVGIDLEAMMYTVIPLTAVFMMIIPAAFYALMLFFLFRHKKAPRQGIYLIILLILNVLGALVNGLSLLLNFIPPFDLWLFFLALIGLILNAAVITAFVLQSKIPPEPPIPHSYYPPPPGIYPPPPEPPKDPFEGL